MVYNIHACLKSIDESFIFAASILKSLGKYGTDVCHHVICVCDRAETNAVSILCSGIQNLLSLTIRCIDSLVCLRICFLHDLMLGNKLLSFILCICDQCICLCLCILKDGILIADDLLITFDLVWSLKPKFTKKLFDFFFIHYNLSCRKWLIFTTVYIFFDFFNDLFNSAAHSKLSLFYFFKSCIFFLTASVISGGANLLRSPS